MRCPRPGNGAKQPDFLDGVDVFTDLDPITNIIRMFDEEEDDTGQDFGEAPTNEPTETYYVSDTRFQH
jgi:hypothetical protein